MNFAARFSSHLKAQPKFYTFKRIDTHDSHCDLCIKLSIVMNVAAYTSRHTFYYYFYYSTDRISIFLGLIN